MKSGRLACSDECLKSIREDLYHERIGGYARLQRGVIALIQDFIQQQPGLEPPATFIRYGGLHLEGRDCRAQAADELADEFLGALSKSSFVERRLGEDTQQTTVGPIGCEQVGNPITDNGVIPKLGLSDPHQI